MGGKLWFRFRAVRKSERETINSVQEEEDVYRKCPWIMKGAFLSEILGFGVTSSVLGKSIVTYDILNFQSRKL